MGVYGGPKNPMPGSEKNSGVTGGREIGTKGPQKGLPK